MITKYKTSSWSKPTIDEVEVESETAKFVTVLTRFGTPRRYAKDSKYEQYHDTWDEAYEYLAGRLAGKRLAAREAKKSADDYEYALKKLKAKV